MTRLLVCTFFLAGTVLAVAAGSGASAARSQENKDGATAQDPARDAPPGAPQGGTREDSNKRLPQPKRIEDSYPLKGDEERCKSVKGLQQLTVDLLAIVNMYKEAHWDVSGPLYLQLHEYFDEQADFYRDQADVFAERVLHLGSSVDGRYSTIVRTTRIPEMPAGYLSDNASLGLLLDRVTVLQKEVYRLQSETEEIDPLTSNNLQDLAYSVDKNLWQLRIHLQ